MTDKMLKILLIGSLDIEAKKILRKIGSIDAYSSISKNDLMLIVGKYNIIIVRSTSGYHIDLDIINAATNMEIIATPGSGTDHINIEEAKRRNIDICAAPGANSLSVAELTIGLVFALSRFICTGDYMVRYLRQWKKETFLGEVISGKTIGVIGFGNIGSKVGKLAAAMNMRVLANDPNKNDNYISDFGAEKVEMNSLLEQSDIVTLHIPLNEGTFHIISEKEIEKMKASSFLLNLSRGGVVDDKAVCKALKANRLAGAALDVIEGEVPVGKEIPDNELLKCSNIIITPHLGAWTHQAQKEAAVLMAENVEKTLKERLTKKYQPPELLTGR